MNSPYRMSLNSEFVKRASLSAEFLLINLEEIPASKFDIKTMGPINGTFAMATAKPEKHKQILPESVSKIIVDPKHLNST